MHDDITAQIFHMALCFECSFLVVCYGSNEGDVGYYLKVKDFLDVKNSVTQK